MKIRATKIFELNFQSKKRLVLNQGGARSSKSFSLAQLFILKCLNEPNKKFFVGRFTYTSLRKTLLKDFLKVIKELELTPAFKYNKSTSTLECKRSGSTIEFVGLNQPDKFQGISANYWLIDECMQVDWSVFQQIILRLTEPTTDNIPNQIFLLYNPTDKSHWIKTKIIGQRTDYDLFVSTYKDNPFLQEVDIEEIENLKLFDVNAWLVYSAGEFADVRGAVFIGWKRYDIQPPETDFDEVYYGLDWGFSTDYTTVIRVSVKQKAKEIYCDQVYWQRAKTNPQINERLEQLIPKDSKIVADSSEPKSCEEFRRMGWTNFKGVMKGAGSINRGLEIMQRYKIFVKSSSMDLLEEFDNYKWLEDKNGNMLNVPNDKYNHGIDAIRYVAMTYLYQKSGTSEIFIY